MHRLFFANIDFSCFFLYNINIWFGCQNPFCAITLQYTVLKYVYDKEINQYIMPKLSKKGFNTQIIYTLKKIGDAPV